MGVELVEGHDLRVVDGRIAMRTTRGYTPIDVLYRRVDDEYLDPLNFKPESMLGVPGILDVYRSGGITIANAPGTGICDDKAIYSYIPDIVEFYTGEKAILKNVPTWRCSEEDSLTYVLDHLDELVVKEVHGSGGYGMLVGPTASKREIAAFRHKLKGNPGNYIAQPTLSLSTVPILTKKGLAPRHVDLRSLCAGVTGEDRYHSGRIDSRCSEEGITGGQFQPGGRNQRYLGSGGVECSVKPLRAYIGCSAIWKGVKTLLVW